MQKQYNTAILHNPMPGKGLSPKRSYAFLKYWAHWKTRLLQLLQVQQMAISHKSYWPISVNLKGFQKWFLSRHNFATHYRANNPTAGFTGDVVLEKGSGKKEKQF